MDEYATHITPLVAMVNYTKGPVLELGSGDYSTPVLHALCEGKRLLVSADVNSDWLAKFLDLESEYHKLYVVKDWSKFGIVDRAWDVAFVDHSPGERRVTDIERLRTRARFVLVHDSEARSYGFEPYFARYKYRFDFKRYSTWTTILSDFEEIPSDTMRS